jgi:hypothetical protein
MIIKKCEELVELEAGKAIWHIVTEGAFETEPAGEIEVKTIYADGSVWEDTSIPDDVKVFTKYVLATDDSGDTPVTEWVMTDPLTITEDGVYSVKGLHNVIVDVEE